MNLSPIESGVFLFFMCLIGHCSGTVIAFWHRNCPILIVLTGEVSAAAVLKVQSALSNRNENTDLIGEDCS